MCMCKIYREKNSEKDTNERNDKFSYFNVKKKTLKMVEIHG